MNTVKLDSVEIVPSKVICIGRNYVEHISELSNEVPTSMVLFNKPNSSITDKLFYIDDTCHFETEISFIVKGGVFCGVGIGIDLTKRKTQSFLKEKGLPWERAKSFDKSAVFSEFYPISEGYDNLWFELHINNKLVQHGGYDMMIHKPAEILTEINTFMTIFDGDILMTGTPKGVGTYNKGDLFTGKLYSGTICLINVEWIVE